LVVFASWRAALSPNASWMSLVSPMKNPLMNSAEKCWCSGYLFGSTNS
jgi:hypothetical protein